MSFTIESIDTGGKCVHCGKPVVAKIRPHYSVPEYDGPLLIGPGSEFAPEEENDGFNPHQQYDVVNFHCSSCGLIYEFPPTQKTEDALKSVHAEIERLVKEEQSRRMKLEQEKEDRRIEEGMQNPPDEATRELMEHLHEFVNAGSMTPESKNI
jgi:hypothetical protein